MAKEIKCTPIFFKNINSRKKIVINRGGTRSSKTYSICQQIARWLFTGEFREDVVITSGVCRIVRKYSATIDKTVLIDFEDVLTDLGFFEKVKINKQDKTYIFTDGENVRTVVFTGCDDQQKLRGMKQDILFCNEANELSYQSEFMQLLFRTSSVIVIDFNPDDDEIWINQELEMKRASTVGDVDVIVSSYRDNTLLNPSLVREIELLEVTSPDLWQVYGLGEYGKIRGLIFPEFEVVKGIPENSELIGYGLDFGFATDPLALVACYRFDGKIILDEKIYQSGVNEVDMPKLMRGVGVLNDLVVADSANPSAIEYLKKQGFNVISAKKGSGSIEHGIRLMQGLKLCTTEKSINLRKEFKRYKWKEDRSGENAKKPIDSWNHAIDATRYLLSHRFEPNPVVNVHNLRSERDNLRARLANQGSLVL